MTRQPQSVRFVLLATVAVFGLAAASTERAFADDLLFFDDFNDDIKDYDKWTELYASGTWWERNQRTEFRLYESGGSGERYEGLESAAIPVFLSPNQAVVISADMLSDIDHESWQWVGYVWLEVTDGTNWIQAGYQRSGNKLFYHDSVDTGWQILGTRPDGIWNNEIEIYSDRYRVRMDSYQGGWVQRSLFPPDSTLKVRIFMQVGGSYSLWWIAGFDNVQVIGSAGGNLPPVALIRSIDPSPAANYQGHVLIGPAHDDVLFDGSDSYDPDGAIDSYLWHSSIDGDFGWQEIVNTDALSPGEHTITLTVTDEHGAANSAQGALSVIDGLVYRPLDTYICPCIEDEHQDDPEGDEIARCTCETGFVGVYSSSGLFEFDANSGTAGHYIEFDVAQDTTVRIRTQMYTIGGGEGFLGTGYTYCTFLHSYAPPLGSGVVPPCGYCLYLDCYAYCFEEFADWDDLLGVFMGFAGHIIGDIVIESLVHAINLLGDLVDMGSVERLDEEFISWDETELFNFEIITEAQAQLVPHQVAYNFHSQAGGIIYAKAARYSRLRYIIIEEAPGEQETDLYVWTLSPVTLQITDPAGRVVSSEHSDIPNARYVTVDITYDGDPDDWVNIPDALQGVYQIEVEPKSGADPEATFSLVVSWKGSTYVLAQDIPVAEIPEDPMLFSTGAPVVTCSVVTDVLWTPDHHLVNVGSSTTVSADCDPTGAGGSLTIEVWSDETEVPDTGDGTGRHGPDAKDLDSGLRLRKERRGTEDGRVYLIIARAENAFGNVGFGYCTVVVPHDQSQEGLDEVAVQAQAALTIVEDAPGTTIAEKVALLVSQGWTQHGVSEELGPHQ